MQQLPKRKDRIIINKKEYSYSDVVNFNINLEEIGIITFSKNDLMYNLDIFNNILLQNKDVKIKFMDWESVYYIDRNVKNKIDKECYLVDDTLRVSREYIDLTLLKNIRLIVPLNYLMWGIKFNDSVDTYVFQFENTNGKYFNFASLNGNTKLSLENLKKIRTAIEKINCESSLIDTEKVLLISDFIQSQTQFIEAYESPSSRGIFVTPDFPDYSIQREKSGLVETVLNDHNGVCIGIANLSTLLLNNPEFDVEVESVYGSSHVWNRVLIDGKYYYFDNTWNITRTSTPSSDGLITLSFSNNYNFFGGKTALNIGNHIPQSVPFYNNGVLSEEDYEKIQYDSRYEYLSKPIYKSYKK